MKESIKPIGLIRTILQKGRRSVYPQKQKEIDKQAIKADL